MKPAVLVHLDPITPWRCGSPSGRKTEADVAYRSDALYAAVCSAFRQLGGLEDWLDATARNQNETAVAFTSCFPRCGEHLLITPPKTLWPANHPAALRWQNAAYIPLALVGELRSGGTVDENAWAFDARTACVLPASGPRPYDSFAVSRNAVDRLSGAAVGHRVAGVQFAEGCGLWFAAEFADGAAYDRWNAAVRSALRWLADSGFGGERSRGWGRSASPRFVEGELSDLLGLGPASTSGNHWLLSLYSPAEPSAIDWSSGSYSLVTRGGRIESPAAWGAAKKLVRMVEEGSVLSSAAKLSGVAPNVAPDGFAHPVFRAGFAVSVALPATVTSAEGE